MIGKRNILFFHPSGLFYGGTEKFLQIVAKYASKESGVYYAYAPRDGEHQKEYFRDTKVTLIPFSYERKKPVEPYSLEHASPDIFEIIEKYHIDLVCTPVSAHYQFPLNVVPATMPFIITSPFGHYASNGNVHRVYVYGKENVQRLQRRGITNLELAYDPIDDFPPQYLQKDHSTDIVVFGRVGRPDNAIFDPISIRAFARLEQKYADKVRYELLSPPPAMLETAAQLGVRNIRVDMGTDEDYLAKFYQRVSILAHARKDGETFGRGIAEAMMAGLPIITHKSHFHNEHLNFMNPAFARWCEPDDVDAYYANMEWFMEHRSEIPSMGQAARQRALNLFGVERFMPPILKAFAAAADTSVYHSATFLQRLRGYVRLWYTNMTILPFYIAKLIAHHVPVFRVLATRIYRKHPWF